MKLEVEILALVQCLIFISQVIVLFVQYRTNKSYRGISWWVRGSIAMALGVIFMPMLLVESLEPLARIANPLIVLGQIFLYIGIMQFLDKKENKRILGLFFAVFIIFYYYYMYIDDEISARTVVINVALAVACMMTAARLVFKKEKELSSSANFTAWVFFLIWMFCGGESPFCIFSAADGEIQ